MGMPSSYHIWTIGCQMNTADSQRLAAQLEALGMDPAPEPESADIVVVNTCVIRQQAEEKLYGRLGAMSTVKKKRPRTVLAVMGCLVGRHVRDELRATYPYVDVFMPPSDFTPLFQHLGLAPPMADSRALYDQGCALPPSEKTNTVAGFMPVVMGCSHACSYCVIPYRRGREYSRPRQELLREARALADRGVREITLLGQIVDRYGYDLDDDYHLADLLAELHRIDGILRLRFLTSHPQFLDERLLDAMAGLPKVCEHLELPVQAGNDEVLARMRRGYTVADYRRLVAAARERMPGIAIHTDIIVGFPGESAAQFEDTLELLREVCFDKVHVAKYSPRPQTYAARRYQDDVPPAEKERRRQAVDDLQRGILTRHQTRLLGGTVQVLVEARDRDRWRGRTARNKLVFFPADADLLGALVPVRIGWTGPYSLVGQCVAPEVEAAGR